LKMAVPPLIPRSHSRDFIVIGGTALWFSKAREWTVHIKRYKADRLCFYRNKSRVTELLSEANKYVICMLCSKNH
jgi:hypothetical protein